ncbi:MAG: hypothetical protein GMKNLPBB_00972 [Myxococcota bacterium]|nr:hypothetical protein [Myxococcota bacterium]
MEGANLRRIIAAANSWIVRSWESQAAATAMPSSMAALGINPSQRAGNPIGGEPSGAASTWASSCARVGTGNSRYEM